MKRSNIARKTAMKPGKGFKQRAPIVATGILRTTAAARKAPTRKAKLKSKGPRMTPIRRAAQGQDCTLRIPGVCNFDPATTVLCHSPYLEDGRGMGIKSPDECAVFGCCACHDVLDGRRRLPEGFSKLDLEAVFRAGIPLTHRELRRMKVIKSESATSYELAAPSVKNPMENILSDQMVSDNDWSAT